MVSSRSLIPRRRTPVFDKSLLVRILGFPATLIHGDPLVLDRWMWLRRRLPKTANGERLIDIGCGTGAFTIGAAKRGYEGLGLSWDQRNQKTAAERAAICGAPNVKFEVQDVRYLGTRAELAEQFDVAICCENIEHILDDRKLVSDITRCLKPGGWLLLTAPNYFYRSITNNDDGPFSVVEDGGHVRRGYSPAMLKEICVQAGLVCEEIAYCSGILSHKLCYLQRTVSRLHPLLGWLVVLPFRMLPPMLDRYITTAMRWPYYSICMQAYKPRFGGTDEHVS